MNRKYRLTRSKDIQRVRRFGKSYAHPLVVLICYRNQIEVVRIAVFAGRSVGNAVLRNRIKRRIREIARPLIPDIQPGWDIIILARKPAAKSTYANLRKSIHLLFDESLLLQKTDV